MEKALLSGEVNISLLHDDAIRKYDGQSQPIAFVAPSEGGLALEQVRRATTSPPRRRCTVTWA
jgi:hypothetical protein